MTALAPVDNRRPVTETVERFLRAMVNEVPAARIADLHLFPSLRQGTYETGVAVIAAWPVGAENAEGARHTIYTARYRLVVKGPDRGRWEFECVAEADAPLLTAETVVRGVQRRSGDLEDPVRYDAPALVHVLRLEGAAAEVMVSVGASRAEASADEVVGESGEREPSAAAEEPASS
jgi:hypothetical protein